MADLTDQQLVVKTIRSVAGEDGLRAMQEWRGGMEVLIPRDPGPDNWLSKIVGFEAAQEIARRLTVIDADGRRTCNMKAYIPRVKTRLQELRDKIRAEIDECLLAGMSTRSTAIRVGVAERDVTRERASLVSIGKLSRTRPGQLPGQKRTLALLPGAPVYPALPAPSNPVSIVSDRKQLWDIRNAIADDGILKGHSTRKVSMAAEVSPSYVRIRRKILLASGRLKPGRIGSHDATALHSPAPLRKVGEVIDEPSPDDRANLGGMVRSPVHEVRP